ncbi:MAG: class I SAM-dependent methyltransferase [Candidatus Bathyarchaeia archaeon]
MKLDVGCGDKPKGDVNCDLYAGGSPHFTDKDHGLIDPKQIPNFVKCDAHYLPFRSNSFDVVIGNHLLEHCKHPYDVLKEFRRVTSRKIMIEVPCLRRITFRENPGHLFTWSEYSLRALLEQFFMNVEINHAYFRLRGRILRKIPFLGKIICLCLQSMLNPNIVAIAYKNDAQSQSN